MVRPIERDNNFIYTSIKITDETINCIFEIFAYCIRSYGQGNKIHLN